MGNSVEIVDKLSYRMGTSSQPLLKQTIGTELPAEKDGRGHYWQLLRENNLKKFKEALKQDQVTCDTVVYDKSGHTILMEAIILQRRDIFKFCTVYGADWDKTDVNGVTALMKSAALGRNYYAKELLRLGASLQPKDNRGMTAKDYAQYYNNVEFLTTVSGVSQYLDDND